MIPQNIQGLPGYTKIILAEEQAETYDALPALSQQGTWEREVVTEWAFTPEELRLLQAGGVLRFTQLCFDQPYHPVKMEVKSAAERLPVETVS